MNYLGIDYGKKRIGLSFGDSLGVAVPIEAAIGTTIEERIEKIAQEELGLVFRKEQPVLFQLDSKNN